MHGDPRPLVLLIDEVDALVGDTLLSVLRQLRTATARGAFRTASSCAGCATCATTASTRQRRIAWCSAAARSHQAESLRLGDFSERETRALAAQHTEQTGQVLTEDALQLIWCALPASRGW